MKIDRLIAIMMVLLNNKKTNADTLAKKFEVSKRTIYRDLDSLLVAGVPVTTTQGVNGGISIEESFKVDKQFFSIKEITNLLVSLGSIGSLLRDTSLKASYEKVKTLVPKECEEEIKSFTNQISIDLSTWQGHDSIKSKLKLVKSSLDRSILLKFKYIDKNNILSSREIEPYKLTFKENYWYLEGFCLKRDDFRMFKLSRMVNLNLTTTLFNKRHFTPLEHSKNGWIKEKLINITVEFKPSLLEQMIIRCGEKSIKKINKSTYRAKMPFTMDKYSYNLLLSYGTDLKCIEPKEVISGLLKQIENIQRVYN